jgi:hypothetical protein
MGAGSSACLDRGGAGGVDHSLHAGEAQSVGQQPNLIATNKFKYATVGTVGVSVRSSTHKMNKKV